jgi:uncharacterized protein DUF3823
MKSIYQYIIFALATFSLWSCKKDNYDPPKSTLAGRIVYKGTPIGVEYDRVPIQLYQYGFGAIGSINGTFDQDGSYSFLLFDGSYKLIIPNNQGPFKPKTKAGGVPDSIDVQLNGQQTLDIEVEPYYMIRSPQLTIASGKVTGTFAVEKIITDVNAKDIESANLYINKTAFVSGADQVAQASITGAAITNPASISLNVTVPSITPTQNYVFARIGVKIKDVEDLIFSPIVKLNF